MSAGPGPIHIRPASTGLLLMDFQVIVASFETIPHSIQQVVDAAKQLAASARAAGLKVIVVRIGREPDGGDSLRPDADRVYTVSARPPNAMDFVPGLGPQPGDLLITKRQWGAFYGTDLELQLRRRKIDTLMLAGVSTNGVVESTAREAFERGFRLLFVEDAMTGIAPGGHEFAVDHTFPYIGRVITLDRALDLLRG